MSDSDMVVNSFMQDLEDAEKAILHGNPRLLSKYAIGQTVQRVLNGSMHDSVAKMMDERDSIWQRYNHLVATHAALEAK